VVSRAASAPAATSGAPAAPCTADCAKYSGTTPATSVRRCERCTEPLPPRRSCVRLPDSRSPTTSSTPCHPASPSSISAASWSPWGTLPARDEQLARLHRWITETIARRPAAPVAHEQAARRVGDDVPGGRDPVLQRAQIFTTPPCPARGSRHSALHADQPSTRRVRRWSVPPGSRGGHLRGMMKPPGRFVVGGREVGQQQPGRGGRRTDRRAGGTAVPAEVPAGQRVPGRCRAGRPARAHRRRGGRDHPEASGADVPTPPILWLVRRPA
jgi:hypothetical protein